MSVSNGASFINAGSAAPGSLVAIQLLPQPGQPIPQIDPTTVYVTLQPSGAPYAMECAAVRVNGGFGNFIGLGPVIALLPANIPIGPAQLNLFYNGFKASAQIAILPASFGLFTISQGFGSALAQQVANDHTLAKNQLTHPAKPGDYVVLYGTGLGSVTQDQVTVMLGGKPASVTWAGPAPGEPGVDTINFVVPDDASIPNDCYVAMWVEIAGVKSNTASISKTSDGGACQSSLGLTAADLATLDAGVVVGLAQLNLSAQIVPPTNRRPGYFYDLQPPFVPAGFVRAESAEFSPMDVNAAIAAQIAGIVSADDPYFGCSTAPDLLTVAGLFVIASGPFDFGKVTLTGPSATLTLSSPVPSPFFSYSSFQTSPVVASPGLLPAPVFTSGAWTFSGSGGRSSSLGTTTGLPFSQQLMLPPEIMATNFSALQTISRQQDQTVTWNPAGFSDQEVVTVTLNGNRSGGRISGPITIICKGPATAGEVVIPASLLQTLAPTGAGAVVELSAGSKSSQAQTFTLPLSNGSSLPAVIRFSSSEIWPVAIQ